jgi:hypothetical protein
MTTPHKHRDVIIAWANGEAIEYLDSAKQWYPFKAKYPPYDDTMTYRIKPKRVKKEGWVNVYECPAGFSSHRRQATEIYGTKESAEQNAHPGLVACARIEWEEEA